MFFAHQRFLPSFRLRFFTNRSRAAVIFFFHNLTQKTPDLSRYI
jgi:hypothetical protein